MTYRASNNDMRMGAIQRWLAYTTGPTGDHSRATVNAEAPPSSAGRVDELPVGWGADPKGDTAFGYVIRERVGTDDDFTWHVADEGIWTAQPHRYVEPTWPEVCEMTDAWNEEHETHWRSMSSFPVRLVDGQWSRTLLRVWHPY